MANIKSAKKRISVSARQRKENKFFKATVNTYIKKFRSLIAENKLVEAEKLLIETISLIDSSASKGVYHANNASRKVARLSSALHKAKLESGVAEKTTTTKKVEEVAKTETPAKIEKTEEKAEPEKKATETKTVTAKKAEPAKKATATKTATAKKAEPAKKAPAKKATATKTTTAKKK